MRRHTSLISLSRDHHDGLITAQLLKDDTPNYKGMPKDFIGKSKYIVDFFYKHLIPHFQKEEEILFPIILKIDEKIDSMINELVREHEQIKNYIKMIENNIHSPSTLNDLGILLEEHIRKEERDLFEIIPNKITEQSLNKIEKLLSL